MDIRSFVDQFYQFVEGVSDHHKDIDELLRKVRATLVSALSTRGLLIASFVGRRLGARQHPHPPRVGEHCQDAQVNEQPVADRSGRHQHRPLPHGVH